MSWLTSTVVARNQVGVNKEDCFVYNLICLACTVGV